MTEHIENYDDRTAADLAGEIEDSDFSDEELVDIREYEQANKDRSTISQAVDDQLDASETDATATDTEQTATATDTDTDTATDTDQTATMELDAGADAGYGESMDTTDADDTDDEPEFVDVKSNGHHYAAGHFFDEVRGEKKENVRYNERVREAEEQDRLTVLK